MDDRWWNTLKFWCLAMTFPFSFYLHCFGFFSPTWVKWIGCASQGLFYFVSDDPTNTCISDGEWSTTAVVSSLLGIFGLALLIIISVLCYKKLCKNKEAIGHDLPLQTLSKSSSDSSIIIFKHLSPAALGLQATSLVIYPLALCLTWAWIKSSELTWIWLQFPIVLYGVAGLFSLIGCIMVSTIDVGGFSYGSSFYICLINSVYVLIQVIIACYCLGKFGSTGSAHSGVSVASEALKVTLMNFVKMLFCNKFKCERKRNVQHGANV